MRYKPIVPITDLGDVKIGPRNNGIYQLFT